MVRFLRDKSRAPAAILVRALNKYPKGEEGSQPDSCQQPSPIASWALQRFNVSTFQRFKAPHTLAEIEIRPVLEYFPSMAETVEPVVLPDIEKEEQTGDQSELEPGYLVICWDDPVNLMDYVTHVFRVVFGWPKPKAEFHMLQVHNNGKSLLTRESFEKAEHYVHQLHGYGLQATMERDQ